MILKSLAMNRALKTGTNLCDAKKNMMTNLHQISQVPAMNSFCLYIKITVLSFINKALKIQPSLQHKARFILSHVLISFIFVVSPSYISLTNINLY